MEFTDDELRNITRALTLYQVTNHIIDGPSKKENKISDLNQRFMNIAKEKKTDSAANEISQ